MRIKIRHLKAFLIKKNLWYLFLHNLYNVTISSYISPRNLEVLERYSPEMWTTMCFTWVDTPQGSDMWMAIHHEWGRYCMNYNLSISDNIKIL